MSEENIFYLKFTNDDGQRGHMPIEDKSLHDPKGQKQTFVIPRHYPWYM